jgi:site-specific DNA recombinase
VTRKPAPQARTTIRCAIYTRKSTEEGLQQEFNSLDAQRESGEAYIKSQEHEGWVCLPSHYDDGGYTGGNMDRPGLERLMADIEAGQVDCVIVYKVDRLSRSLLDFSRLMDVFDKHRISFVSVTQAFNTTHSMGRLTLNILLSFAQFEREIISERTRDKIAATRKKGKWTGGRPMLGYDIDPRGSKLVVNELEAIRLRQIFEMYLQHQSLLPVVRDLAERGWKMKAWTTKRRRQRRPTVSEEHLVPVADQCVVRGPGPTQRECLRGRTSGNRRYSIVRQGPDATSNERALRRCGSSK